MRILPHIYNSALTESEQKVAECSDRIWVHSDVFESYMESADAGEAVTLSLKNGVEQVCHGSLHGVHHDDKDLLYIPSWMYGALDCNDMNVIAMRSSLGLCTGLMIQPHTSEHTHAENPLELLQNAFEQYTVVSPGATIPLLLTDDQTMLVTVLEVRPSTSEPRCIRNCEIELELMRPLDMPLPVPPVATLPPTASLAAEPTPPVAPITPIQGITLGGIQHTTGKSTRELALEAALRRLKVTEETNTK